VSERPIEDRITSAIAQRVFDLLTDELGFHPDNCTVDGEPVRLEYDMGDPNAYPLFVRVGEALFEVDIDVTVSPSRGDS
jgi:hypothetical protein